MLVLPDYFVEEAAENCRRTLDGGGDTPLPQRIANCISGFDQIGVTVAQLEDKIGRPAAEWAGSDVSELGVSFTSIMNGELSKDEEFGARRATVAVQPVKTESPSAEPPAEEDGAPADPEPLVTDADLKRLYPVISSKGIRNVEERKAFIRSRVGNPDFAWPPRQINRAQLDDAIAFLEATACSCSCRCTATAQPSPAPLDSGTASRPRVSDSVRSSTAPTTSSRRVQGSR